MGSGWVVLAIPLSGGGRQCANHDRSTSGPAQQSLRFLGPLARRTQGRSAPSPGPGPQPRHGPRRRRSHFHERLQHRTRRPRRVPTSRPRWSRSEPAADLAGLLVTSLPNRVDVGQSIHELRSGCRRWLYEHREPHDRPPRRSNSLDTRIHIAARVRPPSREVFCFFGAPSLPIPPRTDHT